MMMPSGHVGIDRVYDREVVIGILLVVDDRLVGLAGKVRHIHALRRAEQILKPKFHRNTNSKMAKTPTEKMPVK